MTGRAQGLPGGLGGLPARQPDSHKGHYGRVLLVGGSRGLTGAIALAGMAALRGGAGLVRLAVPDPCLDLVAGFEPSYMTLPLAADPAGRIARVAGDVVLAEAAEATSVGCGPGLGRSSDLDELVTWWYERLPCPAVFDADALNALATQPDRLDRHAGSRVLTPHPGEFARLTGVAAADRAAQERTAQELAVRAQVVVVLKGHRTLVAGPTGAWHNSTGNPGMATGGCGDVLTGLVAALVAQSLPIDDAVRLAVFVHGLAGDLAAAELGQTALIASDLVRFLPAALRRVEAFRAGGPVP